MKQLKAKPARSRSTGERSAADKARYGLSRTTRVTTRVIDPSTKNPAIEALRLEVLALAQRVTALEKAQRNVKSSAVTSPPGEPGEGRLLKHWDGSPK